MAAYIWTKTHGDIQLDPITQVCRHTMYVTWVYDDDHVFMANIIWFGFFVEIFTLYLFE